MKQLPSGIRYGSPWPITAFNLLAPLARVVGWFPRISEPGLLQAVERAVGRSDRSSRWVKEGRTVRFRSFDEDARLTLFGALAVRSQMRRCFTNTLEFDRLFELHPEIENEEIKQPLFVLGWPRTGTTLLQRLLCQHRDARFIPVWEAYNILPEERGRRLGSEERRRRARRSVGLLKWIAPDLKLIHPLNVDDPDECYHLFRNYFAMPPGWDFAYLPGYWNWFEQHSAVPAYALHKRQLQLLQWYDRRGHWVLKSPQHLAGLPALMEVYPDARLVYAHRDPAEAIASYCSLIAVAWGMVSDAIDLKRIADYVLTTAARSERIAREALQTIPKEQIYHVQYRDLTRDPIGTVQAIYEHFAYPADTGLEERTRLWLADNPADRHGQHRYQLEDFGLTKDDVERALGTDVQSPPV